MCKLLTLFVSILKQKYILEKFEIELKWASYFLIVNTIIAIVVTVFMLVFFLLSLENSYDSKFSSIFIIILLGIQFFYFVRKAIKENKEHQAIRFFSKLAILFRVLGLFIWLKYLVSISPISVLDSYFVIENKKKNLSEYLVDEDDLIYNNSNWLNDFVIILSRKFRK